MQFDEIHKYIQEQNLSEVLEDPRRIFNADESAFFLQPKAGQVIARKGQKMYTLLLAMKKRT